MFRYDLRRIEARRRTRKLGRGDQTVRLMIPRSLPRWKIGLPTIRMGLNHLRGRVSNF